MLRLLPSYLLIACTILLSACTAQRVGQGNVMRDERPVLPFEEIEVGGAFNVELRPGPHKVAVETDINLQPYISTEVDDGVLILTAEDGIEQAHALTIYISMPMIKEINATSTADIVGVGRFEMKELTLDLSGNTDLRLEIDVQKLTIDSKGASDIALSGQVEDARIKLDGASNLRARDLITEKLQIKLSDASDAEIHCNKSLKAKAKGSSDLVCHGQPDKDDIQTSDAAMVSLLR